jgi:hypothetical protein
VRADGDLETLTESRRSKHGGSNFVQYSQPAATAPQRSLRLASLEVSRFRTSNRKDESCDSPPELAPSFQAGAIQELHQGTRSAGAKFGGALVNFPHEPLVI